MAKENLTMLGFVLFILLSYFFSRKFRQQLEEDRWPEA